MIAKGISNNEHGTQNIEVVETIVNYPLSISTHF
jgi:hypothetical protein